jgi:maternal embryonic leucine zipper kinase
MRTQENLLLTDELQMKLIDFGLCANPETGLSDQLETCCGSPAYAAPELIKGQRYFGNEVRARACLSDTQFIPG